MTLQEFPARRRVTTPAPDRAREIAAGLAHLRTACAFAASGVIADTGAALEELDEHRDRLASRRIGLAGREARDLERLRLYVSRVDMERAI